MNQRAEYLIQILENIGSPLMASITAQPGELDKEAEKMAALLGKTVQASIEMANMSDMAVAGTEDDSLRLALAALAGPLVAGQYRKSGKIPAEADLKKLVTALQAVLSFSENFSPAPENIERLKNMRAGDKPLDANQINVQYMEAFIPVVGAISIFPFGQPEQKLITDVARRLVQKAAELGDNLIGSETDEDMRKLLELSLMRTLAQIYTACHEAETARLMKSGGAEEEGAGSMEPVWKDFDTRLAMLEALAANILPGAPQGGGRAAAGSGKAPAKPAASPAEPPPQPAPQEPPPAPPEQKQDTPPAGAGQNPMSTFAKKPGQEDGQDKSAEPSQAPQEALPPQSPQKSQPESPPAQKPEDKPDSGASGEKENPMSFFKPETKKDDGS